MEKGIESGGWLERRMVFGGVIAVIVLSGVLFFGTWVKAAEFGEIIDQAVSDAMTRRIAVDFSQVPIGEVEKHFRGIFVTEKTKVSWLKSVLRRANAQRDLVANIFLSTPGMTLAPEDFIEIDLGSVSYTFFQSGRIAYACLESQQEKFSINNRR